MNALRCWLVVTALIALGCGDSGDEPDASPDGSVDASGADAPGEMDALTDGGEVSPPSGSLYGVPSMQDLDPSDVMVVDDSVGEVAGRFVREIQYGVIESGFPTEETRYGVSGRLFIETDSEGNPLRTHEAVALSLRAVSGDADDAEGKTRACALLTGHICVVAGRHVLSPGGFDPAYPNTAADGAETRDSTVLQLNLLDELRRGETLSGGRLGDDWLKRAYVGQIARAGMALISATQHLLVREGLQADPPTRFMVAGHSKWGGAAAQMIAFDPRVIGGVVAGWPLSWMNWLDLVEERWAPLGLDTIGSICSAVEPCVWSSTNDFRRFFQSSASSPDDCDGEPCHGDGESWLEQFDYERLARQGRFNAKRVAVIRNGREAHPVDTESVLVSGSDAPDAFVFLPEVEHTFDSEAHNAMYRHWVRRSFDDAPSIRLGAPEVSRSGAAFSASVAFEGAAPLAVKAFVRESQDMTFGAADSDPAYQSACRASGSCSEWREVSAAIEGDGIAVDGSIVDQTSTFALLVGAQIDDGSGDLSIHSSPVVLVEPR